MKAQIYINVFKGENNLFIKKGNLKKRTVEADIKCNECTVRCGGKSPHYTIRSSYLQVHEDLPANSSAGEVKWEGKREENRTKKKNREGSLTHFQGG